MTSKIEYNPMAAAEATLELTLLSTHDGDGDGDDDDDDGNGLKKQKRFLSPPSFAVAVAWIDPSLKKSTKTLDDTKLHFPLPQSLLQNPNSLLTVQILSSRLPFRRPKLAGTATLPLSSLRLGGGEVRTLQLRKPSGRARGTIRVAARILWCLGELGKPPPDPSSEFLDADCLPYIVDPTAPPLPEGCGGCEEFFIVDSSVPPVMEDGSHDCNSNELEMLDESGGSGSESIHIEQVGPGNLRDAPNGKGAWRSFLVGLASGAVASVLVVAAVFSEG